MNLTSILNLLVALARQMNIDPEELAEMFNEREGNQQFFDSLKYYQELYDKDSRR